MPVSRHRWPNHIDTDEPPYLSLVIFHFLDSAWALLVPFLLLRSSFKMPICFYMDWRWAEFYTLVSFPCCSKYWIPSVLLPLVSNQFVFIIIILNLYSRIWEEGEREREKEREISTWERNSYWLPSVRAPNRDGAHNLGMCLDQESNPQHFGVQDDAPTKQPGCPARAGFIF